MWIVAREASDLIISTTPFASARAWLGVSQPSTEAVAARKQKQKPRRENPCRGVDIVISSMLRELAVQEIVNERGGDIEFVFEHEMPAVEQMQFSVRKVPLEGVGACSRQYLVVGARDDERRRTMVPEVRLECWIKRHVRTVVVEQVELDVEVPRPVEQRLVVQPFVGVDAQEVADTVVILKLGTLRLHEYPQSGAMRRGTIGPIGLDRVPEWRQSLP